MGPNRGQEQARNDLFRLRSPSLPSGAQILDGRYVPTLCLRKRFEELRVLARGRQTSATLYHATFQNPY